MYDYAPTRDYRLRWRTDMTIAATCRDVDCEFWREGWQTVLDERTATGRELAALVRGSGRKYGESRDDAGITVFEFAPGTECFRSPHRARAVRALVTQGRQLVREHTSLADIAEDYTEHTGRLAEQQQKG